MPSHAAIMHVMAEDTVARPAVHARAPDEHTVRTLLLAVVAVIGAVWFLRETSSVTVPLAAAVFVSMLVYPVHAWLRRHLPKRLK